MFQLNQFNLQTVSNTGTLGEFVIRPLPRGFGISVANMIRRTLYSSVTGTAITSVKINGVQHEYSTLKGISDDILKILLKLKEIVFISTSDTPVTLTLSKKGEGVVTAADFEKNSSVTIVNPDFEITTITDEKVSFDLSIVLEKGKGYEFPDDNKRSEVGVMPMDSDFSPIKRVIYKVTQTREGNFFDLDQIELTIETDGSVDPAEALKEACETLNKITAHLVETTYGKVVEIQREHSQSLATRKVDLAIDKLNVSTRLYNCLDKIGIKNLNEFAGKSRKDINDIRGLGDKSKKELLKILQKYGIEILD